MKFYSFVNKRTKFGFAFILGMVSFGAFFLFLPFLSWAAPLSDSMLGYWKFDGNLEDSSGDGNHLTSSATAPMIDSLLNSPTLFQNSGSAIFTSVGSYLEHPGANLSPANQLTFSMWVRFNEFPIANTIIGGNYNETDPLAGFRFSMDGENVYFNVGNNSVSFPISSNIILGSWYHLVGVSDGSEIRLYLNGEIRSSISFPGGFNYNADSLFKLGNFNGAMDEVRLYNRSLGQIEISDLAAGKHTSATWVGSTQIFEDPGSWNTGAIPDPYTIVTIPQTTYQPQLQANETVAGVNILSGASLNISNWNFSIKDGGVFSNEGELILQNTETQVIEGLVNDINSGTVRIDGTSTATSLKTGSQYYNLTIGGTGNIMAQPAALIVKGNLSCEGGIFTLGGSITVYGNINLNGGSLIASVESPISLKGNWSALSGTSFNHGNSTVNLIGTNQIISGFNTFFNFTKNISATDTLFFDTTAGSTLNVAGNLSLNGAGGNFLSLRSTTPGTQWNINPSGTLNIAYLDVMDSNSTSAIDATLGNIIDSGNNTGWIFDNTGPSMSFGAIPTISNDTLFPIFGTASDDNIVSGVNFRTDIIYYPCTANDGSFDESIEDFTCNPISALSDGIHTFYLIAYDINENSGSSGVEKNIIIDTTPPVITAFSVPANSTSTTIEVTDFSVTDANAVAGYLLTETSTVPELNNTGWSSVSQASYAFSSDGTKTLFAWAKDSAGNISASSVASVVISPADTTPPSISSINVIPGVSNVEITWTTNEDSISKIDYGLTNSYGLNILDSTLKLNHNVLISSLNACTTYHFRIGSRDALLNSSFSPDQTFNTGGCIVADTVPPTIASIVASPDINGVSISWMTNEPASSIVEYGTDNNYGQEVSDNTLAHSHNLIISGLNSCTVYYYKVRSLDASSNEGVVSNQSFTTGGCIIPVTDNTTSDTTTSASTVSTVYSSEEDSDSCDLDKPGEPEIISVKARDSKSVILEIDKASGDDDEYEIKYGTASGDYLWQAEDIDDSEIENFVINELKAGTDYYFKVRALNECEKGDWSDEASGKTDQENLPNTQQENILPTKTDLPAEPENIPLAETLPEEVDEIPEIGEQNFLPSALAYQEDEAEEDEDKKGDKDDAKKSNVSITEDLGVSKVEFAEDASGKKRLKLEGFGPSETILKVYVYSEDPIVLTVKTDKDGNWSYVLEDELEDGEHQVYVTVSEDSGKIAQKSNPLVFVKTAQAVSVVSGQAISPTQKAKNNFIFLSIVVSLVGLFLALATIGWKMKASKKSKGLEIV